MHSTKVIRYVVTFRNNNNMLTLNKKLSRKRKETRVFPTLAYAVRDLKYDPQLHNSLEKHKDVDIAYGLRSS